MRFLIVLGAAVALATASCTAGGDTSLYARNDSDSVYLLRVSRSPSSDSSLLVIRILPKADGFALSWTGGSSVPVEVLSEDCTKIGTLEPRSEGSFGTDGAPGLVARLEAHGAPIGSATSGIEGTEECGGALFH